MSDTGETSRHRSNANRGNAPLAAGRRPMDAASVAQRWWEEPAAPAAPPPPPPPAAMPSGEQEPGMRAAAPPPPPPPPGAFQAQGRSSAADLVRLQQLEQELAAARDEASALHEMLEDLPEIFERKFRQRIHGMLEQQQLLLADNQNLRDRLYALQPAGPEPEGRPPLLLPPASEPTPDPSPQPERQPGRPPLRSLLRGMLRLGRDRRFGRRSDRGIDTGSAAADEQNRAA